MTSTGDLSDFVGSELLQPMVQNYEMRKIWHNHPVEIHVGLFLLKRRYSNPSGQNRGEFEVLVKNTH